MTSKNKHENKILKHSSYKVIITNKIFRAIINFSAFNGPESAKKRKTGFFFTGGGLNHHKSPKNLSVN